jgi:autotransporter-associated beta strand protein
MKKQIADFAVRPTACMVPGERARTMRANVDRRRRARRNFVAAAAAAAAVGSMFVPSVRAGNLVYWDPTNGTTAGTGAPNPGGTWITSSLNAASWGDAAGTATPVQWNNASPGGDTAVFAAGTDATGTYGVTGGGAINIAGFLMEEGTQVTVTGQTAWTFAGGSLDVNVQTGLLVLNGQYSGSLITKSGPGVLNTASAQSGAGTFAASGKWVVNQGTITFRQDTCIGLATNPLVADEITLNGGGKLRSPLAFPISTYGTNRGITLGIGGGGFDTPIDTTTPTPTPLTTVWQGPITGTSGGDLQMTGTGTAVLTNTSNNWDGGTTISAGFLRVGASGVIPDTSVVTMSGGTFDLATNSTSETVKSISGTAGTISLSATSTLTLGDPAGETAAQTLNVPSGGKIIKNGTDALTLSGGPTNNTAGGFNGEFILNSGTLGVGTPTMLGGNNTPTATLTINGGKLSNPDSIDKNLNAALIVNLSGDFTVDQSLSATPGVIRFNGSTATIRNSNRTITVNGIGVLDFEGTVAEDVPGRSLTKAGNGGMVLGGANSYTGGTFVNGGTLVAANGDAFAGGALAVADGATTKINPGTTKAVTLTTLNTNASGKVDLADNSMVIKGMPDTQVRALLQSGYNGGHWDGPTGITSSSAAASTETSVGYASNASLNLTEFKGVIGLTATDVLVKYTYAGDANLDGKVDIGDLGLLAGAWQQAGKVWFDGDFTYNGTVDIGDLGLLAGNWQKGVSSGQLLVSFDAAMAQFAAFDGVVVPEPASLALLGVAAGAGGLLRRRRRSRR